MACICYAGAAMSSICQLCAAGRDVFGLCELDVVEVVREQKISRILWEMQCSYHSVGGQLSDILICLVD